jgi:hypothetical protein
MSKTNDATTFRPRIRPWRMSSRTHPSAVDVLRTVLEILNADWLAQGSRTGSISVGRMPTTVTSRRSEFHLSVFLFGDRETHAQTTVRATDGPLPPDDHVPDAFAFLTY